MNKKNIAIIGAGISGLMLGCILREKKIECTIFERSKTISEYGGGISISPNGLLLLEQVGVLDELNKNSCNPLSVCFKYSTGALIKKISSNEFGNILTTNRRELIRVLYNRYQSLNGEIIFNHQLEFYDEKVNKLTFNNGSSYAVNHVVGCDGIKSIIRSRNFNSSINPDYSGYSAWRGIGLSDSKHINFYFNSKSHVVCYPVNNKLETSFIAVFKDKNKNQETWRREGTHDELSKDLNACDNFLQSIFKSSPKVFKWGMYVRPPIKTIVRDNITLLGDAAHPMLPFLGQGGNLALEDAYIFGCLCHKFQSNFELIQQNYQQARLQRVNRIQRMSKQQAIVYHASNPFITGTRNFLLKNTNIAKIRLQEIYAYNAIEEMNKI